MSKVVRVSNSDYKIAVQDGGTITLDTGVDNGTTVITGNLEVRGNTTTVESTIMSVADNIIVLNSENVANGIPASLNYRSGIEIIRGQLPDARFVFDEQISWSLGGTIGTGTFTFEAGSQTLPIKTPGIVAGGNLYVSTGAGVITVTGTTDYEEKIFAYDGSGNNLGTVIDDDTIPNTKAVVDYVDFTIGNVFQSRIEEDDTYVEALDFSVTGNPSRVDIGVDNSVVATFYDSRFETGEIRIQDNIISTLSSNEDLILESPGTGTVKIKDVLELSPTPWTDDGSLEPAIPSEGVKIYTLSAADSSGFQEQTLGNTGIFFVNSNENRDELISKNRSLLYSMIF